MMSDSDFEIDEDFLRDAFGEKAEQDMGFLSSATTGKHLGLRNDADFVNIQLPANPKGDNNSTLRDGLYSYKGNDHVPFLSATAYRSGSCNHLNSTEEQAADKKVAPRMLPMPKNIRDTSLVIGSPRAIAKKTPVRRRKFPGPAGLLPDKISDRSFDSSFMNDSKPEASPGGEEVICSQSLTEEIDESPWLRVMNDFDLTEPSRLSCYNVKWIRRRASARLLVGHKVPFLAIVIKNIDFYSSDPSVVLQDKTGEISGTLHRDFLEKFPSHLKPGTVLVLHRLGVVSTGFPVKRHYLNITLNNLISIYDMDDGTESSQLRVTAVKKISMSELVEEIDKSEAQNRNITTLKDKTNVLQNISCDRLFSAPGPSTNFSSKASHTITNISHSFSDQQSTIRNFVGRGNVDNSRFPNFSSATITNGAIPESHSKREASLSTYPNAGQVEVQPKVQRMSEAAMSVDTSAYTQGANSSQPADAAIVNSIFEGFDCSSLFDDF